MSEIAALGSVKEEFEYERIENVERKELVTILNRKIGFINLL
jgi:hypothetical protein